MGNADKQEFERDVFQRFVELSGLPIDLGAINQLEPPHPDITCEVNGATRGFELTLLTDVPIEKKVRLGRSGCSNFKIEIDDVINIIKKKNKKKYSVSPVDLVIHEGATPIDDLWIYDQSELNRRVQAEADMSIFKRIWLFDMTNNVVRAYNRASLPCS